MKLFISNFILNAAAIIMFTRTSIAILIALCTSSSVDAIFENSGQVRQRRRSLKTPKSPKGSNKMKIVKNFCPVETVTAQVINVQGSTTEFIGATQFPCLDLDYAFTAGITECGAFYADPTDYSALTLATVDFLETGKGTTWDEPLFFNSNAVLNTASFQISTEQSSPGSLNGSSFKGSVGTGDAISKVTLMYMDLSPLADAALAADPTSTFQYNANLFNELVSSIESIQYDFYPAECPGITNCYKQFYLNIQVRSSARPFGDTTIGAWRDCNIAYVPPSGPVGEWTTFKIDANTVISTVFDDCSETFTTLAEFQDEGYVLGTNLGLIFQLTMGDTEATDTGLVGYFDNVQVKLVGEDLIVYDL